MSVERLPPHSEDAERAVLGALLIEPLRVWKIAERMCLTAESFYVPAHRTVYGTIAAMAAEPRGVQKLDALTLTQRLDDAGKLETIGGAACIEGLIDSTPAAANAEWYLDIVRQKAALRRVLEVSRGLEAEVFACEDADRLVGEAPDRYRGILRADDRRETNREVMDRLVGRFERAADGEESAMGLPTPWEDVNEILCGLEPGVTILAGRPSAGKTTVEDQIAVSLAAEGIAVGRFTLDSSREELLTRAMCRKAGVSLPKLKAGFARQDQLDQVREARDVLEGYPLIIEDEVRELRQICTRARVWKAEFDIGLLTLDFVQLVNASDMGRSQWDKNSRVSYVSETLKGLALELGIPLLELSQLSRAGDRDGRRPELTDLRDSGTLEQDAHKVVFVYPDRKWNKAADEREAGATKKKRATWLEVLKHKDGETGRVPLFMRPHYFLFDQAPSDFATLLEMKEF